MGELIDWKEETLMTNRPTNHDRKAEAKKLATPDFSKFKVCNSYSIQPPIIPLTGEKVRKINGFPVNT